MADSSSVHPPVEDVTEPDTLVHGEVGKVEGEIFISLHPPVDRIKPVTGLIDYETYRFHDVIVKRTINQIYRTSSESFNQRQDTILQQFHWDQIHSFHNDTNKEVELTEEAYEGLTIREGQETERNFGVGATFKGLSINVGGSRRSFSERETSSFNKRTKKYFAEPGKTTILYQKVFTFAVQVWFWGYVNGWTDANPHRVGQNKAHQAYKLITRSAVVEVRAEDYALTHKRLSGYTYSTADAAPRNPDDPAATRQYENITSKAKTELLPALHTAGDLGSGETRMKDLMIYDSLTLGTDYMLGILFYLLLLLMSR